MSELRIGPPDDAAECVTFAAIASEALPLPPLARYDWLSRLDPANLRLARRGGQVVGGLVVLPMGIWLGGRSMAMAGIHAVAIAPEHRGAGVASRLMRAVVAELHHSGIPLSTLYPATQPLYRQAGYEQAGSYRRYRLPVDRIDVRDRGLAVERVERHERAALQPVYTARARATAGNLDRSAWAWHRIFEPISGSAETFRVVGRDGIQGYVVVQRRDGGSAHYDLHLRDVVALTPAAGRRILTLLADHRSMAGSVEWTGASGDPLALLLAEQEVQVARVTRWMARVCDARAALAARGYPPGLRATLHLDVRDDVVPDNAGRWLLEVDGGAAEVKRGGDGLLRLDARGLAPLYTGYLAPHELGALGLLDGPPADLSAAGAVFAGPAPWMAEIF